MATHTPGPWKLKRSRVTVAVLAANGDYVTENIRPLPNQEANANLIAAAPDLYEAALAAQCNCSTAQRESGHLVDCWMPAISAAIAKAEGAAR